MVFPLFSWFSHGFPMVFPWFSHGFHGKTEDPELSSVEVNLNGLGGGGWQRRPAEPGTLWRLENAQLVPQGAAVGAWDGGSNGNESGGILCGGFSGGFFGQSLRDDLKLNI
jgi:hypothetical protein